MKRQSQSRQFAKRSLGQNFLTDQTYVVRIVEELTLSATDAIIEIGPGRGALTEKLVESGASTIAIEKDRDLVRVLADRFVNSPSFSLIEGDALQVDLESLVAEIADPRSVKLVANLPYYISTPILQRLAEHRHLFSEMVLMFQREVVERITANPGNSERGFLTVIVEGYFDVEKLFDVPPTAFRPVPKVWSSVVRLVPKSEPGYDEGVFRNVVSAAFGQKRKTIYNNLKASFDNAEKCLNWVGIDSTRRAESLTLDEWIRLTECISVGGRSDEG